MRLPLALTALLALAGCGDAPPDATPSVEALAAAVTPTAAVSVLTGPAPDGSLGTFTLRVAESDAEGAPLAEVAGVLPPPVPAGAYPTLDLADAPTYHVGVDPATLPEGFDLDRTHFIYVKRDADGRFDRAQVLRGWVGLSNTVSGGTYSGTVGGFTFAPLWPEGAPTPGLTYDTLGDDRRPLATSPLGVTARPAWAQPVTLPATIEAPEVTAELALAAEDVFTLVLLYRGADDRAGAPRWDLRPFFPDRAVNRARERSGDPGLPTTTAFTVRLSDLGAGPTEAFLLAFPE